MVTPKIENKLAALKQEYAEKYAAELDNVKKDVETLLENLNDILLSVEDKDRAKLLASAKFERLIAALGIVPADKPAKKKRKKSRTTRTELTEEAVKAFIGKGTKTKSELSAHFKGGNVKVVKFLDGMVKAKRLGAEITKSKKNKDITNYRVN